MDKDVKDDEKRVEWLHSAGGSIFGEPQKTTRVGDEYQAQIPSLMTKNERMQLIKSPVCHHLVAVSCSSSEEPWSAIEHDSFLLGLYIFGKNLGVVNEFMGNKGMPNVISYYYGKFYGSSEHQKWSMYRKKRISKSVPGKKIFKGWRLHELLSRFPSNMTEECKASVTQVIRSFEEGKLSFEKYVFTLRDTMGIDLLVQAVAIGKGKQDLTIKTKTRLRSKKVQSTCSSLKTEEIINILKDRIVLSKSRLNEFFWTAVWPRLLARGWHSEQLRNYTFQDSKNLVFLAPGVTKFSRRSLVKGSQYFDSLTEVLNKVASEPGLLETDPARDQLVQPQGSDDDEKDSVKCTIVDTSMAGIVKVKELTSLTFLEHQASGSDSGETEHDTTEESQNEHVNQVFKQKAKRQRDDNNIKNDNTSGLIEAKEDAACFEKKQMRIVIDLNSPRVGPVADDDNKPLTPVLPETTTNETELLASVANGQRQSRRNRALTPKALEALANGFLNPKRKRRGAEDGTRRRARAKTALVSSCGERYLAVGVFDGSSHMATQSPK